MKIEQTTILSTAYFPPLQYFSKIVSNNRIVIESFENFSKQSYRNRCEILSANGKQTLTVPIEKALSSKQLIKDVKIDYRNNWQDIHLKSLQAAYLSSPFYEYYIDALIPFFEKKHKFLFDYNLLIIETLQNEIQINKKINFSKQYNANYNFPDFRNSIHPKRKFQIQDNNFNNIEYTQVFSEKHGFIKNLSILDLLFNEGPNTLNLLTKMYSK